mmetsp:Transcript_7772/g.21278  ORF Transcript_7772/g.21278 Transcript_7772/m.21278 type:complete len:234 (-) Transcript_7772:31-732(-)
MSLKCLLNHLDNSVQLRDAQHAHSVKCLHKSRIGCWDATRENHWLPSRLRALCYVHCRILARTLHGTRVNETGVSILELLRKRVSVVLQQSHHELAVGTVVRTPECLDEQALSARLQIVTALLSRIILYHARCTFQAPGFHDGSSAPRGTRLNYICQVLQLGSVIGSVMWDTALSDLFELFIWPYATMISPTLKCSIRQRKRSSSQQSSSSRQGQPVHARCSIVHFGNARRAT